MRTIKECRHHTIFLFSTVIILLSNVTCAADDNLKQGFAMEREHMVKTQIEARGITDEKVLNALRRVERHKFVSGTYKKAAYADHPLPIGEGQTISQPYIVAIMTEALDLDSTKKVLEIGTGSGYQAAVLAEVCDSVYTIEIVEALGKRAEKLLAELGYKNIKVKVGDGYKGWKEYSPFDAIIVTCAPTHIPQPLKDQLAEGGKMVIPVGKQFAQELVILTKEKGKIKKKDIIPVRFVPMVGENGRTY